MIEEPEAELVAVAHAWDRAMVENDADAIGSFMAADWILVGPDGSIGTRERFLELVRSGDLTHSVMTSEEIDVRVYGSAAVVIARGISAGRYRGQPFRELERSSSVFVKEADEWRCVLTHLSRLGANV